ncbi:hypothetical protein GCM10023083_07700 [Streptomyces phyllanthi]
MLAYEFVHGGHGCERTWRFGHARKRPPARGRTVRSGSGNTRGPRRLGGTLNPPGTAARSNNGRGVCGPGRPKDEEPEQSGQRARFLGPPSCAGKTEVRGAHAVVHMLYLRIVD